MIRALCRKFRRDRRGATAVMLALMLVPLLVASGAAVDFSRVSAARAQLQEAADAAALAGLGTYQNAGSQLTADDSATLADPMRAVQVAGQTFAAGTASLTSYLAINTPSITAGCTDTSGDTVDRCGASATAEDNVCVTLNSGYCVKVQAQGVLKTSLLGVVIPNVTISVTAIANSPPVNPISPTNAQGSTIKNAYDENIIKMYPVPMLNGVPQYMKIPDPTTSCSGAANGVLMQELHGYSTLPSGPCPYVQIGDSEGTSIPPQPTLSLAPNQPVAFLFINITGNYHPYNWVKQPDGGYCPDFTLYGSISQEPGANVPLQDSTNIYSSAFEMAGKPPSYSSSAADETAANDPYGAGVPYGTNHQVIGFTVNPGVGGNTGTEKCPYYAYHNNTTATNGAPDNSDPAWNATYFPSNPYYLANNAAVPQVVSGCTPNTSATPWNYSGSNIRSGFCNAAQGANNSNCALLIQDLGPNSVVKGRMPTSYTQEDSNGTPDRANPQRLVANYSGLATGTSAANYPPDNTAHRCYDPASGYSAGSFNTTTYKGLTDTGSANYDHIENPQDGAVLCNSADPEVYALYWNDLGSNEADDLGYWNAITLFTCSIPGSGNISAGPGTLSG